MATLKNEPEAPTLLQTATSTLSTLTNMFKNIRTTGGGFAPVVMSLMSLVSQQNLSDQGMVDRIIQLIEELKTDLETTLDELHTTEGNEVNSHNTLMVSLQDSWNSMNTRLGTAE